jgi:hypothetical protein
VRPSSIVLVLADLTGYVLDDELLGPRDVAEGRLRIADLSRRNRLFLITIDAGSRSRAEAGRR